MERLSGNIKGKRKSGLDAKQALPAAQLATIVAGQGAFRVPRKPNNGRTRYAALSWLKTKQSIVRFGGTKGWYLEFRRRCKCWQQPEAAGFHLARGTIRYEAATADDVQAMHLRSRSTNKRGRGSQCFETRSVGCSCQVDSIEPKGTKDGDEANEDKGQRVRANHM